MEIRHFVLTFFLPSSSVTVLIKLQEGSTEQTALDTVCQGSHLGTNLYWHIIYIENLIVIKVLN